MYPRAVSCPLYYQGRVGLWVKCWGTLAHLPQSLGLPIVEKGNHTTLLPGQYWDLLFPGPQLGPCLR